jgi:uncharacterized phage protein (TIGR01671 family)
MTRELKFQVWHKQEQKMYIPNYLHFSPEGRLFGVLVKEGELLSIDDFELREYTGLKDCKGQEIYESDIICRPSIGLPMLVRWNKQNACFDLTRKPSDDFNTSMVWYTQLCQDEYEVIGNVYEHPHILDAKQD